MQHKQLKTMEMSETSPDIYDEGYIHQSLPEPNHQIQLQQQFPWNISQVITKTVVHPHLSWRESR